MLNSQKFSIDTTGTAGTATGSAETDVVRGRVVRVDFDFHASAPATTDVTIVENNTLRPKTVVALTNANTDTVVYPTVQLTDTAGTPVAAFESIPVYDTLTISVAQCDALTAAVQVEIFYEDYH